MSEIWWKMCIVVRVRYLLLLSDCHETSIFWTDFLKNAQIPNFIGIRPVRAELFHAMGLTDEQTHRRTGMTELTVTFPNLRTSLKTWLLYRYFLQLSVWSRRQYEPLTADVKLGAKAINALTHTLCMTRVKFGVASKATRYGPHRSGLKPRWGLKIFCSPIRSIQALMRTQPPVRWVTWLFRG